MIRDMYSKALVSNDGAELSRYRKDKQQERLIQKMGAEIESLKHNVSRITSIIESMQEEKSVNG